MGEDKTQYYMRFFFDLTFFIFVNVTIMNIIFGIIIDTFSELRNRKNSKEDDKFNKCFICGQHRFQVPDTPYTPLLIKMASLYRSLD